MVYIATPRVMHSFMLVYLPTVLFCNDSGGVSRGAWSTSQSASQGLCQVQCVTAFVCTHLHTHSLSTRLNEMCSGALCGEKRMKNNGHSDKIKLFLFFIFYFFPLVLFRKPSCFHCCGCVHIMASSLSFIETHPV